MGTNLVSVPAGPLRLLLRHLSDHYMPPFHPPQVWSVSSLRRGQLFVRRQTGQLYAWWRRTVHSKSSPIALPFLLEDLSTQAAIRWTTARDGKMRDARSLRRRTAMKSFIQTLRQRGRRHLADQLSGDQSTGRNARPGGEQGNTEQGNTEQGKRAVVIPERAWRVGQEELVPYIQDIRAWLRVQGRKVRRARQGAGSTSGEAWGGPDTQKVGPQGGGIDIDSVVAFPLKSRLLDQAGLDQAADPWTVLPEEMRPKGNSHLLPAFANAQSIWLASLGGPPTTSSALYTGDTDGLVRSMINALGLKGFGRAWAPTGALSTLWTVVHVLSPAALLWFLKTFAPELHAFGGDAIDRAYWFKDGAAADRWLSEDKGLSSKSARSEDDIEANMATLSAAEVDESATRSAFPWGPGRVQLSALSHMFLHCASSFLNGPNAFVGEERQQLIDLMVRVYPRQLHDVLMHDIESHEIGKQWLSVCKPIGANALPPVTRDKLARTQERLGEVLMNPEVVQRIVPMVADSCARLGIKPTDAVLTLMERAFMIRKLDGSEMASNNRPPKRRLL